MPKKDSINFTGRLCADVGEKLTAMSSETGLKKTSIVENAVRMYFDYYKKTGKVK